MKTRTLITGGLVFAIGLSVLAAGIFELSYERAVRSARESYLKDEYLDAIRTLERVIEFPLGDPRAHYNLGISLLYMYSVDEAMAEFRKFIAETDDPKLQAEGYYLLAWSIVIDIEKQLSSRSMYSPDPSGVQHAQALEYLREAMRLDPNHKGVKNLYERLLHKLNQQPPKGNQKPQSDLGPIWGPGGEEPKP